MAIPKKDEVRVVKKALAQYGITASVKHGTGTASGWLKIKPIKYPSNLNDWRKRDRFITKVAMDVTGRKGKYDGNINVNA